MVMARPIGLASH